MTEKPMSNDDPRPDDPLNCRICGWASRQCGSIPVPLSSPPRVYQVCTDCLSHLRELEEANERRIDLIKKRTREGLSAKENTELRDLQVQIRRQVDAVHPLPAQSFCLSRLRELEEAKRDKSG